MRKVGHLVGQASVYSRLLDFLGEEGWPIGVGQSPDNPTELSEADHCEGEGERLKYLVGRPTTLMNSKH